MAHEHELDPEYLYPADAQILEIYAGDAGDLRLSVAVPCPECDDVLKLDAAVESATETDLEVPLEDVPDHYD